MGLHSVTSIRLSSSLSHRLALTRLLRSVVRILVADLDAEVGLSYSGGRAAATVCPCSSQAVHTFSGNPCGPRPTDQSAPRHDLVSVSALGTCCYVHCRLTRARAHAETLAVLWPAEALRSPAGHSSGLSSRHTLILTVQCCRLGVP